MTDARIDSAQPAAGDEPEDWDVEDWDAEDRAEDLLFDAALVGPARVLLDAHAEATRAAELDAAELRAGPTPHRRLTDAYNRACADVAAAELALVAARARMDAFEARCIDCHADPGLYMVHRDLWAAATSTEERAGHLCRDCLAGRLGRPLTPADLTDAPCNLAVRAILAAAAAP